LRNASCAADHDALRDRRLGLDRRTAPAPPAPRLPLRSRGATADRTLAHSCERRGGRSGDPRPVTVRRAHKRGGGDHALVRTM
jgi:hypothetical protein